MSLKAGRKEGRTTENVKIDGWKEGRHEGKEERGEENKMEEWINNIERWCRSIRICTTDLVKSPDSIFIDDILDRPKNAAKRRILFGYRSVFLHWVNAEKTTVRYCAMGTTRITPYPRFSLLFLLHRPNLLTLP